MLGLGWLVFDQVVQLGRRIHGLNLMGVLLILFLCISSLPFALISWIFPNLLVEWGVHAGTG